MDPSERDQSNIELFLSSLNSSEPSVAFPSQFDRYNFSDTDSLTDFHRMQAAIDQLDELDRALLQARFGLTSHDLDGSIESIAENFGLTPDEVRLRLLAAWRTFSLKPPPNILIVDK